MNKKDWNQFDLQDYVNNFSEVQRDNVLRQIVESELLEKVFDTTEGKVLLNNVVDSITANTMQIVSLSVGNDKDKIGKIKDVAVLINVLYRAMYNWASMLAKGNEHKKEIKKKKKE